MSATRIITRPWYWLAGKIFATWARPAVQPDDPAELLSNNDATVCYVLETGGLADTLALERICEKNGLPSPSDHAQLCRRAGSASDGGHASHARLVFPQAGKDRSATTETDRRGERGGGRRRPVTGAGCDLLGTLARQGALVVQAAVLGGLGRRGAHAEVLRDGDPRQEHVVEVQRAIAIKLDRAGRPRCRGCVSQGGPYPPRPLPPAAYRDGGPRPFASRRAREPGHAQSDGAADYRGGGR